MASSSPSPPPPLPATASLRRVPPPCWSSDETLALIHSYKDTWLSLRRGPLRAHHWQEVAASLSLRCPPSSKTALQCRHKIEKLRKRCRSERSRSLRSHPHLPPSSPWPFFPHMDSMERPSSASPPDGDRPPNYAVRMRRRVQCRRRSGVSRVADALGMACDGLVRMEQLKMDAIGEIHRLRIEMELRRTQMMLDSQRRIVDCFAEAM